MPKSISKYLAVIVTVAILGGIWLEKTLYHVPSGDADPYHKRVKEAYEALPYIQGQWVGTDVPVPPAAVAMLKPNVLMNRQYRHTQTGRYISFLLVQCGDARDILGHYPPVCYVTHGWLQVSATPRDWEIDGLPIVGTEYTFAKSQFDQSSSIVIYNFMVLPDGRLARDMDAVNEAAQDHRRKFYGAAQVQVVFDAGMPVEEREAILRDMIIAHRELLEVIRDGVQV